MYRFCKLFSENFEDKVISEKFWKNCGQTSTEVLEKLLGQYNGENCVAAFEHKTFFKIFLTLFFNFFTLASNFTPFISYYFQDFIK